MISALLCPCCTEATPEKLPVQKFSSVSVEVLQYSFAEIITDLILLLESNFAPENCSHVFIFSIMNNCIV